MECFTCDKLLNNYKIDKITCANCREVLKIDIVRLLLELDPIYLSESNRNKKGRNPKLTDTAQSDISYEYSKGGISMKTLAIKHCVKKTTIFNIIRKK